MEEIKLIVDSLKDAPNRSDIERVLKSALLGSDPKVKKDVLLQCLHLLGSHMVKRLDLNVQTLKEESAGSVKKLSSNAEEKEESTDSQSPGISQDPLGTQNNSVHKREDSTVLAPICKFFLKKKCKYGTKGNKNGHCQYRHPRKCGKYMRHGPLSKKNKEGCDVKTCSSFHPRLCQSSVKSKICERESCDLSHIVGTKRSPAVNAHPSQSTGTKEENIGQLPFLEIQSRIMTSLESLNKRLQALEQDQRSHPSQLSQSFQQPQQVPWTQMKNISGVYH